MEKQESDLSAAAAPEEGVQAAEQASDHVAEAAAQTAQAAAAAPTDAAQETYLQLGTILKGVERELKRANDLAEASASKPAEAVAPAVETAQAVAPEVEVVTPEPVARKIRRNGRKVTRRG